MYIYIFVVPLPILAQLLFTSETLVIRVYSSARSFTFVPPTFSISLRQISISPHRLQYPRRGRGRNLIIATYVERRFQERREG